MYVHTGETFIAKLLELYKEACGLYRDCKDSGNKREIWQIQSMFSFKRLQERGEVDLIQ